MRVVVIRTAEDVQMEEVPDHLDRIAIPIPHPPVYLREGETLPSPSIGHTYLDRHVLTPDNPALPRVVAYWPPSWRNQWAIDTITEHAPRLGLVP